MQVDRADTFDGVTYIMTESHTYNAILQRLQGLEPRVLPIKHVGTKKSLATGYKVPADSQSVEQIMLK